MSAHLWFTPGMRDASKVAQEALNDAIETWNKAGLTKVFQGETASVWKTNLARHETELGDDNTTLGTLCARNLANRVQARVNAVSSSKFGAARAEKDDRALASGESQDQASVADTARDRDKWAIPDLKVDRPRGALRLTLEGRHFYVMKAPMSAGRTPDWDSLVNWDAESDTRHEIAKTNFRVLDDYYNPGPGQGELWSHTTDRPASAVREFLVVWGGEPRQPRTAGWMTVPGLGASPFVARSGLRWDKANGTTSTHADRLAPVGPSFDEKPSSPPLLALKPRPSGAGTG